MNPLTALLLANDHIAELQREAARERLARPARRASFVPTQPSAEAAIGTRASRPSLRPASSGEPAC